MGLLQMSISAAVLILVIAAIRAVALDRLPKVVFLILWGIVLFRLFAPIAIPITVPPLMPFTQEQIIFQTAPPQEQTAFAQRQDLTAADSPTSTGVNQQGQTRSVTSADIIQLIWLIGVLTSMCFFTVIYVKSYRRLQAALPIRDNAFLNGWIAEHKLRRKISILQSEKITSPLAVGLLKPRIILPKSLDLNDEQLLQYILIHEYYHIMRFDALWKLLAAAALCIHWFNPLVWVMTALVSRDLELTCDEMVVRHFGMQTKKAYAYSIISMAEQRNKLTPFYNGFSKSAAVERINSIMKINKKPFISTIMAVLLAASMTLAAFAAPKISSTDLGSLSNISDKDTLMEAAETFVSLGIIKGKGTDKNGEVVIDFASKITQQEMLMLMARTDTGLPDWFGSAEVLQLTSLPVEEMKQNLGISDINPVYLGAVLYCYESSMIREENINPECTVTVCDVAEMVINALGYMNIPNDAIMDKAIEIGLFAGFEKSFANDSSHELTRGEAILLLYNFFNSDRQFVGMWWDAETQRFNSKAATEPVRAVFEEYADERLDQNTISEELPSVRFTFDNGEMLPIK